MAQNNTKISVVTPSFNQAPFIERTIRSVLSQDWPSLEYVVFDGGSTDGTVEILKKYGNHVRWVSQKDDGQGDAVNRGILATSGEIIGWINSDDIYYPGAVRAAVEYFDAHPEADVVYGMADHIDLEDRPFECYRTEPWDFDRLLRHCFICQPATFFRRSVVQRCGLLDATLMYCMDYEYWLRLGVAGLQFGYLEQKLAGSRMYADNKTMGARLKVHREINDMFRARFGRVPANWIWNYVHVLLTSRGAESQTCLEFQFMAQVMLAELRWNRKLSTDTLRAIHTRLRRIRTKTRAGAGLISRLIVRFLPPPTIVAPDTLEEPALSAGGVSLSGLYDDGWAGADLRLSYLEGDAARSLNLTLFAPEWLQSREFNLVARDAQGRYLTEHLFRRGQPILVHIPLPKAAGMVKINIEPMFSLHDTQTSDCRAVTVMVTHVEMRGPGTTLVLFSESTGRSIEPGMPA